MQARWWGHSNPTICQRTKLRGGNVFTGVCLSTGVGVGISGPMSFLGGDKYPWLHFPSGGGYLGVNTQRKGLSTQGITQEVST